MIQRICLLAAEETRNIADRQEQRKMGYIPTSGQDKMLSREKKSLKKQEHHENALRSLLAELHKAVFPSRKRKHGIVNKPGAKSILCREASNLF